MNKTAAGWATILTCITMCAITYGVAIRPVIKRRKTESFSQEAAFLFKRMQENRKDSQPPGGAGGMQETA